MFSAQQFCDDYNIDYAKSGKHRRSGWINISCPFCSGHAGYHLGVNIESAYTTCHRCGFHSLYKVIAVLTGVNSDAIKDIIKKYSTEETAINQQETRKNIPSEIIFPPDTKELTDKAKKYLISRNFDPDKLVSTWNILSTGHIGFYKHRILAPIYYRKQLVSYQCRDITSVHLQKYLACFQNEEIIEHQNTIYGIDLATTRQCVVVEGITDCWRLGRGAVATFGINFTKLQAQLIAVNFNRVFTMFDSESQAQAQAQEFGYMVSSAFTNPVEVINLPFIIPDTDPGNLSQDDANALMRELGF